jgi:predicted thioesterase
MRALDALLVVAQPAIIAHMNAAAAAMTERRLDMGANLLRI